MGSRLVSGSSGRRWPAGSRCIARAKKTTVDGATVNSSSPARPRKAPGGAEPESPKAKLARLEAENAELRAETAKLTTEREILRQAAKYFAGETNW